jgi:hypothetical protein
VSAAVLSSSMSLDGYVAGPNDKPGNPGGDALGRLHDWFGVTPDEDADQPTGPAGQVSDEHTATGAVLVHGGCTAHRALEAGVLDELQAHLIPVLSGGARRLFEVLPSRVEWEIVRVTDTPEGSHIRYHVRG